MAQPRSFERLVQSVRYGATSPVVTVTTPSNWTDAIVGTDQLSTVSVNSASPYVIQLHVKGTVSKTVSWQATADMFGWTAAADESRNDRAQ